MEEDKLREFSCHNDAIQLYNNEKYENIFTESNLVSNKKVIRIKDYERDLDGKFYGFFLEKGKERYFCIDEFMDSLPFKVQKSFETDYRNDVFNVIEDVKGIRIPAEKRLEFRELVDKLAEYKHTNPTHWTLYKISLIASLVDRTNFRVCTGQGFGKDSIIGTVQLLRPGTTSNIYGATFAKLEYSLTNKLICLNEMGNLSPDERMTMQEFLLATGAYSNIYTKRTRKTATTQEQYDLSELSLVILYNLPSYYTTRAQDYFDQMFTPAVNLRFIPFVFDGQILTEFENLVNPEEVKEYNEELYADFIGTLAYYDRYPLKSLEYDLDNSYCRFTEKQKRYKRSFTVISKYIAAYANSQEEFDKLTKELYDCYKTYGTLIAQEEGKIDDTEDIK